MRSLLAALSPLTILLASCGAAAPGEKAGTAGEAALPFTPVTVAGFDEPWAMAIDKGSGTIFVTEKKGHIRFRTPEGRIGMVTGVPAVDYGGQGGLGDFVFAPGQASKVLDRRVVYLSWAEAGPGDTRGAAVAKADMTCQPGSNCALENLKVIWRQTPKVTGRGHYSHRIAFSPDGQYLFISSGERQKMTPAQDLSTNLGKVVRLLPDGSPAPGNPFADKGSPGNEIWSYGHRNLLGLAFDADGRLWDVEHGPAGGDELNLVRPGQNYGWPLVSDGDHYDGRPIPRHATRPDFAAPAISWNPVIAPGDLLFYRGGRYPALEGKALIPSFAVPGLVAVRIEGEKGIEDARYALDNRIRAIDIDASGTLWLLEDGPAPESGHLLRLDPAAPAN